MQVCHTWLQGGGLQVKAQQNLHGTTVAYCNMVSGTLHSTEVSDASTPPRLLEVVTVLVGPSKTPVTGLLDSASDQTLVTHSLMDQAGIPGRALETDLFQAGEVDPGGKSTCGYSFTVFSKDGVEVPVTALGMDFISKNTSASMDIMPAYKMFP